MRLVFAGTPRVAVPGLRAVATDNEILAVITRRDGELGRKRVSTPTPVADAAAELGLSVIKANRLDDDVTDQVARLGPDLGVIVAYGGLVREPLLSTPTLGWINLHFSLLPAWRGAAPVQRAIMAGESESGASVFQLVPELDAGNVFGSIRRSLHGDETAAEVLSMLAEDSVDLLVKVVRELESGVACAVPQSGTVTLAPKLTIADARITWQEQAPAVYNRIRAVTPEPGAFTTVDGARLKILQCEPVPIDQQWAQLAPGVMGLVGGRVLVGTLTAPIELSVVQPAGKRAMIAADWWRGLAEQQNRVAE